MGKRKNGKSKPGRPGKVIALTPPAPQNWPERINVTVQGDTVILGMEVMNKHLTLSPAAARDIGVALIGQAAIAAAQAQAPAPAPTPTQPSRRS